MTEKQKLPAPEETEAKKEIDREASPLRPRLVSDESERARSEASPLRPRLVSDESERARSEASEAGQAKEAPKAKGKKKTKRQVSLGRVYIKATYNNTIITFTDALGNALAQCSAGQLGFKGPKKSTPYAAGLIVAKAVEKIRPYGLKEVNAFIHGVGGGREAAIRALNANGINVLGIKDITPIPHNGCRAKKPRRV